MARVKRGVTSHAKHKKVLKLAKGYVGRSSTNYRVALERVEKDTDRNYWMSAEEAKDYGIVSRIVQGAQEID